MGIDDNQNLNKDKLFDEFANKFDKKEAKNKPRPTQETKSRPIANDGSLSKSKRNDNEIIVNLSNCDINDKMSENNN